MSALTGPFVLLALRPAMREVFPGRSFDVDLDEETDELTVTFHDTGETIEEKDFDKLIFDKFHELKEND